MERIEAAGNLVIEIGDGLWQLTNGRSGEYPLLAATAGSPLLAYRPIFAHARQLPDEEGLGVGDVDSVVVGWSRSDRAWHLGFLLGPRLASTRGGRWCELAHWPDDYALLAAERAEQAGQSLAGIIGRPFRFIEAPHMTPATGPLDPEKVRAYIPPPAPSPIEVAPSYPTPPRRPDTIPVPPANTEEVARSDWMKTPDPAARGGLLGRLANGSAPSATSPRRPTAPLSPQILSPAAQYAEFPDAAEGIDEPTPVVRVGRRSKEASFALPIDLGDWVLRPIGAGVQWARTGVWSLGSVGRVIFNVALGLVFILLSVLTLRSPYSPVQPIGLPLLGILIGIGLIVASLRLVFSMLRTEATAVDTGKREVRRHLDFTSDVVARYRFDEVRAVVVSQSAQQRHRHKDGKPDTVSHEAWLHLLLHEVKQEPGKQRRLKPEDAYVTIGHVSLTEGQIIPVHFEGKLRTRLPQILYADEATTPAQKAAMMIARAIGVDAYIDQR